MAFLRDIGFPELLIILFIVLLLLGANKLPDVARSLGSSIQEFKEGVKGQEAEEQGRVAPDHHTRGRSP